MNIRAIVTLILSAATAGCGGTTTLDAYPDSFVGVGMVLEMDNDWPQVRRVIRGGSAATAGVTAGDVVERIDGLPTEGLGLGNIIAMIRGKEGSQVTLAIRRPRQRLVVVLPRRRMSKSPGRAAYQTENVRR